MQDPINFFGPSPLILVPMVLIYLGMLATPVIFIVLIVRFLRAYERRTNIIAEDRGGNARVEALESNMLQLRTELDRIQEGQRFTNQLLAEQPSRTTPRG